MAWGYGNLGGGGGDRSSTLPPPVTGLTATGGNKTIEVSFETVPVEYEQYLGSTAYIVVVKKGGVPESPTDGEFITKLDKNGGMID